MLAPPVPGAREHDSARSLHTLGRGVPPRPSSTAETSSSCLFASVILRFGEQSVTAVAAMARTQTRGRAHRRARSAAPPRTGAGSASRTARAEGRWGLRRRCAGKLALSRSPLNKIAKVRPARKSLVVARPIQRVLPRRGAISRPHVSLSPRAPRIAILRERPARKLPETAATPSPTVGRAVASTRATRRPRTPPPVPSCSVPRLLTVQRAQTPPPPLARRLFLARARERRRWIGTRRTTRRSAR